MQEPQKPENEEERLGSLRRLNLLDTDPEDRFDRITRVASKLFGVPIALVSLVDANRQWFKSCVGLGASETPRGVSFCGHAILQPDAFVIEDATLDDRFKDNPLVTGEPHVIFYAGMPLSLGDGTHPGTLCLIDTKPREFSESDRDSLRDMAKWVEIELNMHDTNELLIKYEEEKTKLADSKNRLELATSSAGIGIWDWDVVNNVLSWDDQMYELYGIKAEDFSGAYEAWQKGLHNDDVEPGNDEIQLALKGEKEFNTAFRVIWPSGEIRYLRAFARVERSDDGTPLKMIGVNLDITHEMEIDKAKSEFVSLASHQLRTPLSAINWFAQMLEQGDAGELNDEQKLFIKQVLDANERMVALVDSLLNVSRVDLGTFAIKPEMVMLSEISDSVLSELTPMIEEKRMNIEKHYDPEVPEMLVDEKLTRIIFQNYLSNAIKYTPNEGKVMVSITHKNDHVEIAVTDTGYGVPEGQKKHIFEKLFRADNVREMETEGTGLGLYIVKAIAVQAGGSAWFESEINKGSTFFATIPLSGMQAKDGNRELS